MGQLQLRIDTKKRTKLVPFCVMLRSGNLAVTLLPTEASVYCKSSLSKRLKTSTFENYNMKIRPKQ